MRAALLIVAVLASGGCASEAARHCGPLAGASWTRMAIAPDNAEALLAMQGLPDDRNALWYSRGDARMVACVYAGSLTNPGCGAAVVYEYAKVDNRWTPKSMAMESCNNR